MRNATGRSSISEMNTYHRFVKQPKGKAAARASASAGPHVHAQLKNPAAPATTQGKPFNHDAPAPPQKPSKRLVIMKSARKGPAR
jgi:hypothetical protein